MQLIQVTLSVVILLIISHPLIFSSTHIPRDTTTVIETVEAIRADGGNHTNHEINHNTVKIITDYLSQYNKLDIDFIQTDYDGQIHQGKILIDKPHKFRLNYYPPFPFLIIGNKKHISIYDYDMEQTTILDATQNMLSILLDRKLNISNKNGLRINKAVSNGSIAELEITNDSIQKSIIFVFNIIAHKLHKIILIEDEIETCLEITNIQPVQNFNAKLFEFRNPIVNGPPPRLDKQQIEEMRY